MKEFEGIKDIKFEFCQKNTNFVSLIPSNSFVPNSNKLLKTIFNHKRR
jgi:hypothetical protein